ASFGLFVAGLLAYFSLSDARFLPIAVFGFAMMVPFSAMFSPSKFKSALLIYAIVMAVAGLMAIGLIFSTGEIFNTITLVFIIGFIGFQWIANFLLIKED